MMTDMCKYFFETQNGILRVVREPLTIFTS